MNSKFLFRGVFGEIARFENRKFRRVYLTAHRFDNLSGGKRVDFLLVKRAAFERAVEAEIRRQS